MNGIMVKTVRCENAGENKSFEKTSKLEGHSIKFEYTAPGTPQQNGRVERKFKTLYGRIRAILAGSGFSRKIQLQLWTEAANTATLLDSYLITDASDVNSYQKIFGNGKRCPVTEPTKNRALYPIEPRLNQNYEKEEKKPIGSAMQVNMLLICIVSSIQRRVRSY